MIRTLFPFTTIKMNNRFNNTKIPFLSIVLLKILDNSRKFLQIQSLSNREGHRDHKKEFNK
jgi:hypothetical protein